jgi:membrane protease YdiL (CAAX protease family)
MMALAVAGVVLVIVSVAVYGKLIHRIAKEGGKVVTANFGTPDLLAGGLLGVWFVTAIIRGVQAPPKPVKAEDITSGVMVFLFVVTAICSFLYFRGIDVIAQFGIRRVGFPKFAGIAILLMLAAYPLIGSVSAVTQKALGGDGQPQELVKYFHDASARSDYTAIITTMVMAVFFAPMVEEFIFRGYFHGVQNRYTGIVGATLINAGLFAAIHLNESSLPSLFLLAVCFTIAYEFTGSLLVNICMHSLFNLTNLLLLFYAAHHVPL